VTLKHIVRAKWTERRLAKEREERLTMNGLRSELIQVKSSGKACSAIKKSII
jgi:hypothetical protein